ncbi:MAG: hypothetical protein HETSPECPRED_004551 [Heterodermia speciosa]|uniref:Uncharacterized protein n=1 Tax=Heterodermia speciosa TaxID=116794 RepID=A0A8H3FEX2_9LECA|nr:MAG: hypothetical protein HETSPECPRED_004551 [Heterodermia speciosa]
MYNVFTTFIVFASICLARPSLNKTNSAASNALPTGFPPGELPPSDEFRDTAGNLLLPFKPDRNLEQRFKFEKATTGPLKGSHLIYSISLMTLDFWKDNRNAPFRERQEIRLQPYTDILHTIRPGPSSEASAIGALTPSRAGIVYVWMMRELLLQPTWPGLITASIYYAHEGLHPGLPLGEISIKDKPQADAASALTRSNNSTSLEASIAPQGNLSFATVNDDRNVELLVLQDVAFREKAWLSCFIQLIFKILKHPPSAYVRDHFPRATGGILWNVRSNTDPQQMAYIRFAPSTLNLTWYQLAATVLSLCARAARNDRWQNEESARIFEQGSIFIAEIKFKRV